MYCIIIVYKTKKPVLTLNLENDIQTLLPRKISVTLRSAI